MSEKGLTTINLKKNKPLQGLPIYIQNTPDFQNADRPGSSDGAFHRKPEPEPAGKRRAY